MKAIVLIAACFAIAGPLWSQGNLHPAQITLDGVVGRPINPSSLDKAKIYGASLAAEWGFAKVDKTEWFMGLSSTLPFYVNGHTMKALSVDVLGRISMPISPDWNPYVAGSAGYCPLASATSMPNDWQGKYHGSVGIGNRGYFSNNWGMDAGAFYQMYSPSGRWLQAVDVRLGLTYRMGPKLARAVKPEAKAQAIVLPEPQAPKDELIKPPAPSFEVGAPEPVIVP
jgi:hypothetical protein